MKETHPPNPNGNFSHLSSPPRRKSEELSPRTPKDGGILPKFLESSPKRELQKLSEHQRSLFSVLSPKGKSPNQKQEPMGMLSEGRARMDAAKAAVEILGSELRLEPLPDNVISWGSVVVEGKFLPVRYGESCILSDGNFKAVRGFRSWYWLWIWSSFFFQLVASLPARLRSSSWTLLYSTNRDGIRWEKHKVFAVISIMKFLLSVPFFVFVLAWAHCTEKLRSRGLLC